MRVPEIRNRRGAALFVALMVLTVLATLAIGAIMMSGNASLLGKYHAKDAEMRAAADAGLEWARDTINGTLGMLPAGGFNILQFEQPVRDAGGAVIPGFTRSVFAGRSGAPPASSASTPASSPGSTTTPGRAVVVRRAELAQESFAQFARFDDVTISNVVFANGIQVFGPIHTNGILYVGSIGSPAIFHGRATTSATVQTASNGTFRQGYKHGVARIELPTPTALATLRDTRPGDLVVNGGAVGTTVYDPNTRIEFVPVDINGDNDYTDENEGFFRVYEANNTTAVRRPTSPLANGRWAGPRNRSQSVTPNCGDVAGNMFRTQPRTPTPRWRRTTTAEPL